MGLRIKTNVPSLVAQRKLGETSQNLERSMERLSSGQRINRAADDAAGLGVSENLKAKLRSVSQAKRNASDGISLIQVAEGGMNEISNILIRLRELSTQAASDTIGNAERSFANREYVELVEEIDRIGNVTEFNGVLLLRGGDMEGNLEKLTIHVGAGDGVLPNKDTIDVDLKNMMLRTEEDLGLTGGAAIGPETMEDMSGFDRTIAASKLEVVDKALDRVNSMRSNLGAKQSRLESTINNLSIAFENMNASNSRIRDVDFATETASYTQSRILQQGGVSILSQANALPELALSLLR